MFLVVPFHPQHCLGYLFHRCLLPLFQFVADAASDALLGAHALAMSLLVVDRLQHDPHNLFHLLRRKQRVAVYTALAPCFVIVV